MGCVHAHTHTYACGQNRWSDWQPCSRRRSKRARPPTRPRTRLRLKSLSILLQVSLALSLSLSLSLSEDNPWVSLGILESLAACPLPRGKPYCYVARNLTVNLKPYCQPYCCVLRRTYHATRRRMSQSHMSQDAASLKTPVIETCLNTPHVSITHVYAEGEGAGYCGLLSQQQGMVRKVPCFQDPEKGITMVEACSLVSVQKGFSDDASYQMDLSSQEIDLRTLPCTAPVHEVCAIGSSLLNRYDCH